MFWQSLALHVIAAKPCTVTAMSLVLVLLLLWTIIHGAKYFLQRRKPQSLLPASREANSLGRRRNYFWESRTTQVILNKFHLRVQTSAWNSRHDILSKAIAVRPGARLRPAVTYFYNAGCVMGVLGTVISLGLLVWNCIHALLPFIHGTLTPSSPERLLKRGLEVIEKTVATGGTVIKPLVCFSPTIQMYHFHIAHLDSWIDRSARPPARHFVGGFLVSDRPRAWACHLCCAVSRLPHRSKSVYVYFSDAVPIMSAGASFTVLVPAAFVAFSTTALEALEPFAKSRIIAAGPFHNLVFWCLLLLVDRVGTGEILTRTMYRDVSDVGRVVMGIDGVSSDRPIRG